MLANCGVIVIFSIYRPVPILNLSTFFSEEGLTGDYFSWEDTL